MSPICNTNVSTAQSKEGRSAFLIKAKLKRLGKCQRCRLQSNRRRGIQPESKGNGRWREDKHRVLPKAQGIRQLSAETFEEIWLRVLSRCRESLGLFASRSCPVLCLRPR